MGNQVGRTRMSPSVTIRVAGVGLVACLAYMIGTQGLLEPVAQAFPAASGSVTVKNITPPAIVLAANERAIVGAADGVFYVVDYEGNAAEVRGERTARRDVDALFWRSRPF